MPIDLDLKGKEGDSVYTRLQSESAEPAIASLYSRTETARFRELSRVLQVLGDLGSKTLYVINDLNVVLAEGIRNEFVSNLRRTAEKSDIEFVGLNERLKVG